MFLKLAELNGVEITFYSIESFPSEVYKNGRTDNKSNYQILSFIRETPDKIERTVEAENRNKNLLVFQRFVVLIV